MTLLHVLHVIDGLGLGGAERMLVDIANCTATDGNRVSVCVTRSNATLSSSLDRRIELLVLGRSRRLDLSAMLRFVRWVRERNVDVIHVHMRSSLAFVLPLRMLRLLKIPIVFHDHYGTIEIDRSVPPWFRVGRRYVDQYVGVYDRLAKWAQDAGIPAQRTRTISNTLDLARLRTSPRAELRTELGVGPGQLLAVATATIRRDKGIEILLKAVAGCSHLAQLKVVIAGGDGEVDYVATTRALWRELGLVEIVRFLGPRTDVPALLAVADIGLMSSHTESGPLVLIEYLAVGIPIVATEVGDIGRRLAALGVPGFVPSGDAAAFAAELDCVIALAPADRIARGHAGRIQLERGWDIASCMPRWYEVYTDAIQRSAESRS